MASAHPATATAENSPSFWACTKFDVEEVRYTWTIHKFNLCKEETGKFMKSPVFKSSNGQVWALYLYPRGRLDDGKDHVSLFVHFDRSNNTSTLPQVEYGFTLLNVKQEPVHNLVYVKSESKLWKCDGLGQGIGSSKFVKRDDLIEFLKNDPLIIFCKLAIYGDEVHTSGQSCNMSLQQILPIPEGTLSDDLGSSFKDPNAGDMIIEVDGKEFRVKKGILQARSPGFAAMFQHEMEERIQNRVIIADFEPEVVEEMLTYIYTDTSPNLQTMATDLLSIADKYNIERLKMMSAEVLLRKLANENAIETLILAELYRVNELKTCVIHFLTTNSSYFTCDTVWESIVSSVFSEHPNLIVEVTKALFDSKK